jgi:hypothetical protein
MSEQTTASATPEVKVSWDAVRALAVAVGVREAARRLGISEAATRKRCQREGWLKDDTVRQVTAQSVALRNQPTCRQVSPAQAIAMELARENAETRAGFSRAMAGVAKYVSNRDPEENLADASNVKAAAQTAGLVHSWADQQPASRMRIDVLLQKPEAVTIECESQVVDAEWDDASDSVSPDVV